MTDEQVRSPNLLPGWTVGHVVTHLARNADAHARRLTGALHGVDVPEYRRGAEQRHEEIEAGGRRSAAEITAHRLREVELHHVDLGLGYTPSDWPAEYVAWDLPVLLATVPGRLGSADDRLSFTAWLAGRGPFDPSTQLAPW